MLQRETIADPVDWSSYAAVYDYLLTHNPAYASLVAAFQQQCSGWRVPSGGHVLDLGAGTGNFSTVAATLHPHAHVVHLDADAQMARIARHKATTLGLSNITVVTGVAEQLSETDCPTIDALICVHALYTFPHPEALLARMARRMSPGAPAFLVDLGRVLDLRDWSRWLALQMATSIGLRKTAAVLWKGREIFRQNRRIRMRQVLGEYWTHTQAEFINAVERSGLTVQVAHPVYRGYSDLVVATRG